MKKVIVRILVLFLVVFTINQIVQKAIVPYDWGDNILHEKNQYFNKNKSQFNTAFVGGSLFYRHIDATKFDSITNVYGIPTKSFNYGVDGNNHIKQMIVVNNLLKDNDSNLKYMFLALSSDAYFEDRNLHTKKFITWIDWNSMCYAIKVTMDSDAPLKTRLKVSYQYILSWLENKLNAGMGLYLVDFQKDRNKQNARAKQTKEKALGLNNDGFMPYHYAADVDSASLPYEDQLLYWSNNHFKRNLPVMDSINQTYKDDFSTYQSGTGHINQAMLDNYLSVIKKAEQKGIQVIVLLPPRSRLSYKVFLPLYEALPENNRMNMADIFKYPEFYDHSSTFNFYHMNALGADLYSQAVAQEFLKLNGKEVNFYLNDGLKVD